MRVLHLISSGGMYGAEAVILNLSRELNAGEQHASSLGVFAHAGQPVPALHEVAARAGVASQLLPCKGQLDLAVLRAIRDEVDRVGADVVHAHGYKADIYAYLALRGAQRPALVSTCHTWYDNDLAVRVYGAADRWVLRSFDQVVAVSAEVRDRLLGAGVRGDKVHLIRNGISIASLENTVLTREHRASSGGGLRVGLVGRLAPEKGVDLFLRAAARLVDLFPEVTFVVAGDGPDRAALDGLLVELGLVGKAELAGPQTDMPEFYASLDLLVSASRQEGLPMALLEGMASGLAVVATRVGAVPEVVLNGQTGFLVEPGDPDRLAAGMERLLADSELRESFGLAGRRRIVEQFSAQRMAADYLSVYTQALSTRASAQVVPQKSGI